MANHPNRGRKPRPREHLEAAGKLYPSAWQQADQFRREPGEKRPDWCYLPLAAAYAIVSADAGVDRLSPTQAGDVARIGALAAWRIGQGIYRFDPALYSELIATPVTGDLPHHVLYRLPEWCVYIETPDLAWRGDRLYGAWVHLEWDVNHEREELRLLMDGEAGLDPVVLYLGDWTLDEALAQALGQAHTWAVVYGIPLDVDREALRRAIEPIISLTLYLCSANADRPEVPAPRPKKTKRGWRLFPADRPSVWYVGERVGSALRRAYQREERGESVGSHGPPRPHVRLAHWHTYWTGPGRQTPSLRWLPPIPINVDNPDDLPPTSHEVRGDG